MFMAEIDPLRYLQPAATRVRDTLSGRSLWLEGMVQNARVERGALCFDVVVSSEHESADRRRFMEELTSNLRAVGFDGVIRPRLMEKKAPAAKPAAPKAAGDPVPGMSGPGMQPHGGPIRKKAIDGVKHVIAVASGKGGVGKSTVATNLAVGLQQLGLTVGLLDADIYGPSLPVMMNVSARPMVNQDKKVIPMSAYGVRCLSMGLMVDPEQAMIWRGPMVMGVVRQFLQDTAWGELDVLVVDLPPGTGDVQLTLIQAVDLSGAVLVTTPQEVALADAVRGIEMFKKLKVPLLGLVENMAYYQLPDGSRDYVFGQDGGKKVAERYDTEVLGELPLKTRIRASADNGLPAVLGEDEVAEPLKEMARTVAAKLGFTGK